MPPVPRIAILGLNYPPESTGIAPYTGALAAGLAARGYQVVAHVGHPHYPDWRIADGYGKWTDFERIDAVEVWRRRHWVPSPPRGLRRLLSELSFGVRLVFARWGCPDVVIAISPALFSTAVAILRRRNSTIIVWVQDLYALGISETQEGSEFIARVIKRVESFTLRRADRVVVIHQRFANYVIESLGVDPRQVEVIRNWTHLEPQRVPIDVAHTRIKCGWHSSDTVVLHAGNMGLKQGLENVLAAAKIADERKLPILFVLLGGGAERDKLLALSAGIDHIQFIDSLPLGEFQAALCSADILLINEKSGIAEMAVPSKMTSYFDAARPVIAVTDSGGITASEVHAAGAGMVVPVDRPEALVAAILQLRADADLCEQFGASGRRYREQVLDQSVALDKWARLVDTSAR